MFYETIFEWILWIIQKTSSSGPTTLDYEKKWKHDKETLDKIDTGYGFYIDEWDISVRTLDYILSYIPIYDEEATIDPAVYSKTLEGLYAEFIPSESVDASSLIDFFLNNAGSFYVKDNVVDLSKYEEYEVRDKYERYGGKVYIADGKIDKYEYMGKTYDGNDQKMDKIIRATLCLDLMVHQHALNVHLNSSQRGVYKFYERYSKDHQLKDLLYLISYEALQVNRRIPILVAPHGIVARLFSLTTPAFTRLLHEVLQKPAYSRQDMLGHPNTEWNKQLTKYAQIIDKYVDTFDISDEEKQEISDFMIMATAVHGLMGDSQLHAMVVSQFFLPSVTIESPGFVSKLQVDLLVTLLLSVSGRQPLCVDKSVDAVFVNKEQRNHWIEFRKTLLREYPNRTWFDPTSFELSVGY